MIKDEIFYTSQLHRLQEEYEKLILNEENQLRLTKNYETENKFLQKALKAKSTGEVELKKMLDKANYENEKLIIALQDLQEDTEQYLHLQEQLDVHFKRLQNVLERNPSYWHYETLEISALEFTENSQTLQWRLTEVNLGDQFIPELRFKTIIDKKTTGIILQRSQGCTSSAPLVRWPVSFAQIDELSWVLVKDTNASINEEFFSLLGSSDWVMLKSLVSRLATLLSDPIAVEYPAGMNILGLRDRLLGFGTSLANWPVVLRYDKIELVETLQISGYQGIGIRLSNVQLRDRHWAHLEYRLASVSEPGEKFGQHPRLEFHERSPNGLQNWFAESNDERGARLELRFANPNAMDTQVWDALDGSDRFLIFCLITDLGNQIKEIERYQLSDKAAWQSWVELGQSIKTIFIKNRMLAQRHKMMPPRQNLGT